MMIERRVLNGAPLAALCLSAVALSACGGDGGTVPGATAALPQLAAASGAKLSTCTDLAGKIAYPNTTITSAASVAAGVLTVAGKPVPAHCLVQGSMHQRVGPVDG